MFSPTRTRTVSTPSPVVRFHCFLVAIAISNCIDDVVGYVDDVDAYVGADVVADVDCTVDDIDFHFSECLNNKTSLQYNWKVNTSCSGGVALPADVADIPCRTPIHL